MKAYFTLSPPGVSSWIVDGHIKPKFVFVDQGFTVTGRLEIMIYKQKIAIITIWELQIDLLQ